MKKSTLIIFFISLSVSLLSLPTIGNQMYSALIFWCISFLWIIFILYQIIHENSKNYHILALISIFSFLVFLRVILRPDSFTLWGSDPYVELANSINILNNSWMPSNYVESSNFRLGTDFPFINFFGLVTYRILGLNLIEIVNWMPIFISISSLLFLYLITLKIYNSKRIALISVYLFALVYSFVDYHSLFIKETIGFILFSGAIYCYILAKSTNIRNYSIISVFFAIITVFSHHLTAAIVILFLSILVVVEKVSNKFKENNSSIYGTTFLLIFVVSAIGYWFYLRYSPIEVFLNTIDLPQFSALASHVSLNSSYLNIIRFKDFLLAGIIGLFAISTIYIRRNKIRTIELSLLIFGIIMGLMSIIFSLFVPLVGSGSAWGGRFILFGYWGLSIISAYSIYHFLRNKNIKPLIIVFLFLFATLQVYNIYPSLYDHTASAYELEGGRFYVQPAEQSALLWFTGSGDVIMPDILVKPSEGLWNFKELINENITGLKDFNNVSKIEKFDYTFLPIKPPFNTYNEEIYNNNTKLSKIYSTNDIEVFKKN